VEVLAADDDSVDPDPAAVALSRSRQWVLPALRVGGDMRTVKQLGDRLAQAGHPLKPRTIQTALGELEAAGLAAGGWWGRGHGMTRLATSWIEASPNRPWNLAEPPMEPRMSRWFASSSLTSERHQGGNVLTSAAHHHENQAAAL
jgi:hypothetical protein